MIQTNLFMSAQWIRTKKSIRLHMDIQVRITLWLRATAFCSHHGYISTSVLTHMYIIIYRLYNYTQIIYYITAYIIYRGTNIIIYHVYNNYTLYNYNNYNYIYYNYVYTHTLAIRFGPTPAQPTKLTRMRILADRSMKISKFQANSLNVIAGPESDC